MSAAPVVVTNPAAGKVVEWAPSDGSPPAGEDAPGVLHPKHVNALLTTFEAERAIKTMRNINSIIAVLCMLAPFCAFFIPGGELEGSSVPYARFTFTFYIIFIASVLLVVEFDIIACQVPARRLWGCVGAGAHTGTRRRPRRVAPPQRRSDAAPRPRSFMFTAMGRACVLLLCVGWRGRGGASAHCPEEWRRCSLP